MNRIFLIYAQAMRMPITVLRMGIFILAIVTSTSAVAAASPLEQTIASASIALFANSGAPGMVITGVHGDTLLIQGYGETQKGNHQQPDANSLLRVGSISKVLATDLMVKLAEEGKLKLSDPLQKYAPLRFKMPYSEDGAPITLLNLATHTSGLSKSVNATAPVQTPPFTWPDKATRWDWLSQQTLISAPGRAALYSNVAYDLLADAISVSGKKPYDQLLREKVTAPLKMHDTTATPTAEQCDRLMIGTGIDPAGPCADTRATAGSGGMYSTATDMGVWMQHVLGIKQGGSATQRAIAQATYFQRQTLASVEGLDLAGTASGLGLGWILLSPTENSPVLLQKTGGGGGFMSYMVLIPGRQTGIFIAVTKVDLDMFAELTRAANDLVVLLDVH